MSRDYAKKNLNKTPAKRSNTRNVSQSHSARWPWMLSGFVLGILMMGAIQSWETPRQDIGRVIDEVTRSAPDKNPQPHFDFHTLLRDAEIIVPDVFPDDRGQKESKKGQDEVFILQAGSFNKARDADSLRANLLLLNLNAQVEKTLSSKGTTWHRVLVGPFESHSKLANARSTLLQNGIDNFVLKRTRN